MTTATADRLRHAIAAHAAAVAKTKRPIAPVGRAFSPPDASTDEEPHDSRSRERTLPPIDRILGGEWLDTTHGPVFIRDTWFPLDHEHGASTLGDVLDLPHDAVGLLAARPQRPAPSIPPAAPSSI